MEEEWLIKRVATSKGPFVNAIQYQLLFMQYEAEFVVELTVVLKC